MIKKLREKQNIILIVVVALVVLSLLSIYVFKDNLGRDFSNSFMLEFTSAKETDEIKQLLSISDNYNLESYESDLKRVYFVDQFDSIGQVQEQDFANKLGVEVSIYSANPAYYPNILQRAIIIYLIILAVSIGFVFFTYKNLKRKEKFVTSLNMLLVLMLEEVLLTGFAFLLSEVFSFDINIWTIMVIPIIEIISLLLILLRTSLFSYQRTSVTENHIEESYRKFVNQNMNIFVGVDAAFSVLAVTAVIFAAAPLSFAVIFFVTFALLDLLSVYYFEPFLLDTEKKLLLEKKFIKKSKFWNK
jgi:uncharacterized protein YxeA